MAGRELPGRRRSLVFGRRPPAAGMGRDPGFLSPDGCVGWMCREWGRTGEAGTKKATTRAMYAFPGGKCQAQRLQKETDKQEFCRADGESALDAVIGPLKEKDVLFLIQCVLSEPLM
jgi:hypothetical protein